MRLWLCCVLGGDIMSWIALETWSIKKESNINASEWNANNISRSILTVKSIYSVYKSTTVTCTPWLRKNNNQKKENPKKKSFKSRITHTKTILKTTVMYFWLTIVHNNYRNFLYNAFLQEEHGLWDKTCDAQSTLTEATPAVFLLGILSLGQLSDFDLNL
jgi:hypothetical protein